MFLWGDNSAAGGRGGCSIPKKTALVLKLPLTSLPKSTFETLADESLLPNESFHPKIKVKQGEAQTEKSNLKFNCIFHPDVIIFLLTFIHKKVSFQSIGKL